MSISRSFFEGKVFYGLELRVFPTFKFLVSSVFKGLEGDRILVFGSSNLLREKKPEAVLRSSYLDF